MQKNLRQKIFIALGVVIFNLNLAIAGVPEDGTIIIFAAESEVNFNVSGCEPSMISKVIYFKVDASAELHEISASANTSI